MPLLTGLINQKVHTVPSFELANRAVLKNAPVALGPKSIPHLLGPDVLGSPYGSASPVTVHPITGKPYGTNFPRTMVRDDARTREIVLDSPGGNSVAVVITVYTPGLHLALYPTRHLSPTLVLRLVQLVGKSGLYEHFQPASGLAAARMSALLTYGSRGSIKKVTPNHESQWPKQPIFTQFNANCYIHITRKIDAHDIARGRIHSSTSSFDEGSPDALIEVLVCLLPRALVISIATDSLFTPLKQKTIADAIPDATLVTIESPDGHDGFLFEFEEINRHVLEF
ncbi:Alpha/Beta hydrolase protein [Coprinopsis sp. MPI-PUGE-AT-0042]|nr:Alpha/Beta hydrolase protein [Coprinopsis sp. MPI-PUGE-AT-0042]